MDSTLSCGMTKPALLLLLAAVLLVSSGHAFAADARLQSAWVYKCEQQVALNETLYADEYMVKLTDVSDNPIGTLLILDLYQRNQFVGRLSMYEGEKKVVSTLKITVVEADAQAKGAVLKLEHLEEVRTYEKVAELTLKEGESTPLIEHKIEKLTLVDAQASEVNVLVDSGAGDVEHLVKVGEFVGVKGIRLKPELFNSSHESVLFAVYAPASPNLSVTITSVLDEESAVLTYTVELLNSGGADVFTLTLEHGSSISEAHTESLTTLSAHEGVRYAVDIPVVLDPVGRELSVWADVVAYDVHQSQIKKEARAEVIIPPCISVVKSASFGGGFPQSKMGKMSVELVLSNSCNRSIEVELTDTLPQGFYAGGALSWTLTLPPHTTTTQSYWADAEPTTSPKSYTAPPATLRWHLGGREGTVVSNSAEFDVHGPHIEASQEVRDSWVELTLTNVGDEDAEKVSVYVVDVVGVVSVLPEPSFISNGFVWDVQKIAPGESVLLKYRLERPESAPQANITFYDVPMGQMGSTQSSYGKPSEAPSETLQLPESTSTTTPLMPAPQPAQGRPPVSDVLFFMAFVLVLLGIPALIMLGVMR
ncbi:MAG: hypothetical protein ACXQS4_00330 [Methermicoccaceae archaeon]